MFRCLFIERRRFTGGAGCQGERCKTRLKEVLGLHFPSAGIHSGEALGISSGLARQHPAPQDTCTAKMGHTNHPRLRWTPTCCKMGSMKHPRERRTPHGAMCCKNKMQEPTPPTLQDTVVLQKIGCGKPLPATHLPQDSRRTAMCCKK